MERINEILKRLVLEKGQGNQAKVAAALGVSPQRLGHYLKGRKLPLDFILTWKKVYGEDLVQMAEGKDVPTNVVDTTVVNETIESPGQSPTTHQILMKTIEGLHKLIDSNNSMVDKLDKDKNWAFSELEKLHAKFGLP